VSHILQADSRTRLGNWLTREQAKELLTVLGPSTMMGKHDYDIQALLVGGALRWNQPPELELEVETIQKRGCWVLADLEGKGRRIRTVAIPIWGKQGIDSWMTAAGIEDGRLLRSLSKSGKVNRSTLIDWAVWSEVEPSSKQILPSCNMPCRPANPPWGRSGSRAHMSSFSRRTVLRMIDSAEKDSAPLESPPAASSHTFRTEAAN
jgi:integrase